MPTLQKNAERVDATNSRFGNAVYCKSEGEERGKKKRLLRFGEITRERGREGER